jgi:gliding motility-associated-like protein
MKFPSKNPFRLLLVLPLLMASLASHAQLGAVDGWIKNSYVEIGVGQCGVYGTSVAPPAGYHPNAGFAPGLGFVCDYQRDGWATATGAGAFNYCGDYFVPGSPVEGWALTFNGNDYINTDTYCGVFDIPGSITYWADGALADTIEWTGSIAGMDILQRTVLPTDSLFFITQIVLCNTTALTMNDVYYGRNLDPDNEQPWTGDFTTDNVVVSQPAPPGSVDALVTSIGLANQCFLGLGARDARARVNHGGFGTVPADDLYNGVGRVTTVGTVTTADEGNGLGFSLGDLAPGECTCLSFAYVMNASSLGSALAATYSVSVLADTSDISASLSTTICRGDTTTLTLGGSANSYAWVWTPNSTLSDSTSLSVQAWPDVTTTYSLDGVDTTGKACANLSLSITVYVQDPVPSAGPDKVTCPGGPITIGGPPDPTMTYVWTPSTFLSSSTAANPTFTSPTVGSYTYILQGTTSAGCVGYDTVTVTVDPLPTPSFTLPDETCIGEDELVSYTGIAVPGAIYLWNFGAAASPGSASTSGPHTVNWGTSGVKYVSLAVVIGPCTTSTVIDSIMVWPNPVASITTPIPAQCLDGNTFSFSHGGSYIPGTTFFWTFGPDAVPPTSTAEFPSGISFTTAGTKTVTLVVTEHGCPSAPVSVNFTVYPQPVPAFTWTGICHNDVTQFTSTTPGTIVSYTWNFGDGTPVATGAAPTHTYASPGGYNVNLTVVDNNGCTSDTTIQVVIHPLPTVDFTFVHKCFYTITEFTDISTLVDPFGSTIIQWDWNFGDPLSGVDNVSNLQNPTHAYPSPGIYTVTFTATSSEGCSQTLIRDIEVPIVYPLTGTNDTICIGERATLWATGDYPGTTIKWYTSSGATVPVGIGSSFLTEPLATTTTYWAALYEDATGCISLLTPIQAVVIQAPVIDMQPSATVLEVPNAVVEFHLNGLGTSWAGPFNLVWNFGDGSTSTEQNPVHQYQMPGQYTVTLMITDSYGCNYSHIWNELITVEENIRLHVPNAFTPNGDGINDFFYVESMLVRELTTQIYDRWGKLVYESENLSFQWDGKDSKGLQCSEGAYTFVMRGYALNGQYVERKGTVLIMR